MVAGWKLDNKQQATPPKISPAAIEQLQAEARTIDMQPIRKTFVNLVHNLRATGIKVSDRRAVKIQNLLAASALISGRKEVIISDLWALKYIWDTEEQIEILAGLVDQIIEKEAHPKAHPQALFNKAPNAETLVKEVQLLQQKWDSNTLSFEEQNIVKDKLRHIQSRVNWVQNKEHKAHIEQQINDLWQKMLQTIQQN